MRKEFIALKVTCKYEIATEDIFKWTLDLTYKIYSSLVSSKCLSKYQILNTTGHFFCRWSGLPRRSFWSAGNEQQERGASVAPFLTWRVDVLLKSHNFACHYTDVSSSDEQVSDNKKYPSFPLSIQQRFIEHLPSAVEVRGCYIFVVIPTTTLRMTVVVQGQPQALPAICVVQRNSIFRNHKFLNLSVAVFPAFSLFCVL